MSTSSNGVALAMLLLVALLSSANCDELSINYYQRTCPNVEHVVRSVMEHRVAGEPRVGPAILRLLFHDCFVNGCDGSVLLDATPFSPSEKTVDPNLSLYGFHVIDEIKSKLEDDCPATVSCADIIALASRDAVGILGGTTWNMPLGRKDSRAVADPEFVESSLPSPNSTFAELICMFGKHGLDGRDMIALSGAHTVGMASCLSYKDRLYNSRGDYTIDPSFAAEKRQTCPFEGSSTVKAPFDEKTPRRFDNAYYQDLIARRGLLISDQVLYGNGGAQDNLVEMYSKDGDIFARDFTKAMVKMGNIPPPNGMPVEVRLKCSMINQ